MSNNKAKEDPKNLASAIESLVKATREATLKTTQGKSQEEYKFWNTQPVPKLDEKIETNGPIEVDTPHDQIRKEPLHLPESFQWCELDLSDEKDINELYELLRDNYVEDVQSTFRFDYSKEMLRWALCPPGYKKAWHVGIRVQNTGKLVAFIGGTPVNMQIYDITKNIVEINFLCVHKKLRSKRLAPVLIREITRKVNVEGIFQAIYTAGATLPKPVSSCSYYHRSINPKKLIDVGFSALRKNMTMASTIKHYKLPEKFSLPGFRAATLDDLKQVHALLEKELKQFDIHQNFSEEEVKHYFFTQPEPVHTYVVEDAQEEKMVAFISFYTLPNTILHNSKYDGMKSAYLWYYAAENDAILKNLVKDALVAARDLGHDVFNALEMMRNKTFLNELKFALGDGTLNFYLFNWRCPAVSSEKQAFVVI